MEGGRGSHPWNTTEAKCEMGGRKHQHIAGGDKPDANMRDFCI